MKTKNYFLMTLLGLSLALNPIKTFIPKNNDIYSYIVFDKLKEIKLYPPLVKKISKPYINPFLNIKGNLVRLKEWDENLDSLSYLKVIKNYEEKINQNTDNLINSTIDSAYKEYQYERKIRKEHRELCSLILEEILRTNEEWSKQKDSIIKARGLPENSSYFIPRKERYYYKNPTYEEEAINFQKKLRFFGSYLANPKKKKNYNPEREKELRKFDLEPTDCITFVLNSLSKASGKNYKLSSYANAEGLAKKMISEKFEGIYIAQNTIKTDSEYNYSNGSRMKNFTTDYLREIKRGNYPFKIDYLVTDSLFETSSFQEFLKSNAGILFFQEGHHCCLLNYGDALGAHMSSDPLKLVVFYSQDLISLMDNNKPSSDYQSAILYVPKGCVEYFLAKNHSKFQK